MTGIRLRQRSRVQVEQEYAVTESLLTVKQAAARLALGRTTVYQLIAKHELKTIKIGRARRIPESALEEWIRQQVDMVWSTPDR